MKRRNFIAGLTAAAGGLGAGQLLAEQKAPSATGADSCQLITQDVTGPFHTDSYPDRSNLLEGQKGLPLTLNFLVRNVMTCEPLSGAKVIIWHANNEGFYSSVINPVLTADGTTSSETVDFRDQTFHRGMQTTDASGRVQFVTAFPGWYFPRATHLHLKVFPPDFGEEATTQLYFRNEICDEGGYQATHELGVVFYGGMFGELTDHYRQG